jgi:hypothetical protein
MKNLQKRTKNSENRIKNGENRIRIQIRKSKLSYLIYYFFNQTSQKYFPTREYNLLKIGQKNLSWISLVILFDSFFRISRIFVRFSTLFYSFFTFTYLQLLTNIQTI